MAQTLNLSYRTQKLTKMKLFSIILGMAVCSASFAVPQQFKVKEYSTTSFRTISHSTFKAGEELKYRLHYGAIDAGEAVIKVKKSDKKAKGRSLLHVVAEGKSISAFDMFFKVRDRYESYIDEKGVFPWVFVRRVNEGGYKINQDYTFFQHKSKVDNGEGKQFEVPKFSQDMISSFFYARTLDYDNAKVGQTFTVQTFVDDQMYDLKIKYMGKETVKLRKGKFKCMKFQPIVQEGRIFSSSEDLQVWITDDKNRIPILVKSKILVGSIKMEVVDYKNLANPIAKVEE